MTGAAGPVAPRAGWQRDGSRITLAAGALFAVSSLPYLAGYLHHPPGEVFNGFVYLFDDANTYLAKMREGALGAWGWSDPYISRPLAHPVLLFLFYLLFGKLTALLHLPLVAGYHLARLSGAVVLAWSVVLLGRAFLPPGPARRYSAVMALSGSGIGFIALLLQAGLGPVTILGERLDALDLRLPELSGFYSVAAIPHFAWAAALVALALVCLVEVVDRAEWRAAAGRLAAAAALLVGLCLIHPQMLFVLAALAGVYLVLARARPTAWLMVVVAFTPSLPLLAYYLRILSGDAVIQQWSEQWRHQAPGPLSLLLALGIPLALAGLGARRAWAVRDRRLLLLVAWVLMVFALLYLPNPVNIQRRLIDGIYLPIVALGGYGLAGATERLGRGGRRSVRRARRLGFLVPAVASVSSLLVLGIGTFPPGSGQPCRPENPCFFLSEGESEAMAWLRDQPAPGTRPAVLSDPNTGLYIPAQSGDRVYVGHYSESLDFRARVAAARSHIAAGGEELAAFMREEDVSYLFYGPRERLLGGPGPGPGLRLVYTRDGVALYALSG